MKKLNRKCNWDSYLPNVLKLLRVMKLTIFLIVISVFSVLSSESYSQTKKITVKFENATVEDILENIEKQSEFYFFIYSEKVIDVERKVSLDIENQNIESVLNKLFEGTDIAYAINDRLVILSTPEFIGNTPRAVWQQATVSGKVTDNNNQPLPGVSIVVKGTTQGTVTNADGNYSLTNIPPNAVLVFSFVGMRTQEVVVGSRSIISVTLDSETIGIEEVVAVGYGSMKKSDLTGSVSQVKTSDIELVPVYNVSQALKSQAAGVRVQQNSGTPGGRIEINIRGGNSMIGDNEPLYVVDGFPVSGGINFLNPSDIESIDILKDASSTAIYGSRGANGVVIITTKRGLKGQESRIEVNSMIGFQSETNRYEMLDAKQYAEVANEWLRNAGQNLYFDLSKVENPGTDWQDFIFHDALLHNHTISFSGSTNQSQFMVSGNYYDQEGIMKWTGVRKGSLKINLDHTFNKVIHLAINLNLLRSERNNQPADNTVHGGSMLSGAMAAPPTLPIYDEFGKIIRISQSYSFGSIAMENPAIYAPPRKSRSLGNNIIGNSALTINFTEDLSLKSIFGLEYVNTFGDAFNPIVYDLDIGSASQSMSFYNSFLNENILTYSKLIEQKHSVNIIGGYTYQNYAARSFGASVSGFDNNILENYYLGAAQNINIPSSGFSEWTLASVLSRINYSFSDKYLFTASVRADGSSRFGESHKWGIFPSGAIAWRVSEESFMKDIKSINSLKIRASYGVTGSTALSPYQSLNRLSPVKTIYGNHTQITGFVPSGIANPDLKWESTAQLDFGFDLSMFNNYFRFTFDYYKKNTFDLLASVPLPQSSGFTSSLQNIGEIQNSGLEFSLGADILRREFKWDISTQLSTNRNEVIKLAGGSDILGGGLGIFGTISLAREGEPLGVFYGFQEDGLDEQGYIKYIDRDGDEAITPSDRTIIGSPYPDFIYGLTSNFSYKNFDLNVFIEGVYGNDIWWATAATHLNSFQRGSNQFADLYGNYWTAENPDPKAKYMKVSPNSQISDSDRFVKDGSYIRLRSLRLAYNIPAKRFNLAWFESSQIFLSGTNLLTITKYPGIDPDVNTTGSSTQDITSRLSTGVDQSAYPISKIYSVGLRLNF
jgi:TonB-linked SusC/RagA family outer membrane protein